MSLRAWFYLRRNRNLAALAGVAVVSVALAMLALNHREAMVAPKHTTQLLLPGLAHALNAGDVTRIRIASRKGSFDVEFAPTRGWVLPGRANYPASFETVKSTLVALAAMETVEPKTDNPALFHFVDLDAPPRGNGIAVTLTDDKGRVVASLIAGKSVPVGDDSSVGLFVRKAGESQSWLVRSPAEIKSNPSDWMDKTVVNIDRSRVAQVSVQPESGPSYNASRAKPGDENFQLAPLPKGRELAYAGSADLAASAATDFTFDDIKPASDLDFANAARVIVRTYDGLTVTVELIKQGDERWAHVYAAADPGKAAAANEAHAVNLRAEGWAYKLPAYKAASFAAPLESLLKPKK
jgi:hypothetical protein